MTDVHLDLDTLADLLCGEGPDDAVSHIGDCTSCAEALADLDAAQRQVAAALRALPAPVVPTDLAARLTGAFAAERPLPARTPAAAPAGPAVDPTDDALPARSAQAPTAIPTAVASATVTPLRRPRRAWLPAAAAVLVVCAAGYGLGQVADGGSGAQTAAMPGSAGGGQAAQSDAADSLAGVAFNASGRDYGSDPAALAQALPAVLAGTAATTGIAAAPPPTGPEAAAAPAAPPGRATPDTATAGLERLRDPAELASCLSAILPPDGSGVRPLALDYAAYSGKPALVVVLPATDPRKVDVFVVGAACSETNDATLFFTRLDRPASPPR